jgi:hypothetical protein
MTCILVGVCLLNQGTVAAQEPVDASLYDVMILHSDCLENSSTCMGERVEHFVEYYGGDWCEPCELIEQEIDELNASNTFVLQHHPSPSDATFLSDSRIRFIEEHRLLFLPSIVVDGEGLLTGSSQGLELSNALSLRQTNYTGLSNVELNGSMLTWDSELGDRITVWRTDAVDHERRNRTHPFLATDSVVFNSSDQQGDVSAILENWNGSLVIVLERTGQYRLISDSTNPSIGINVFDEAPETDKKTSTERPPSQVATIWTVILIASLLPAFYLRYSIALKPPSEPTDQEE